MERRRTLGLIGVISIVAGAAIATESCFHSNGDSENRSSSAAVILPACNYSVWTAHNDVRRSGAQTCEQSLTPTVAPYVQRSASFGVDEEIYAQPLLLSGKKVNGVVQDALFVATIAGTIYILNPTTLQPIVPALHPFPTPVIDAGKAGGIMSTPVIDVAQNKLFVVGINSEQPLGVAFRIVSYNIETLAASSRVAITGTCAGTSEAFSPLNQGMLQQLQRPALLLDHGHVYVAFGGNPYSFGREDESYNGWLFAFDATTSTPTSLGAPYCVQKTAAAGLLGRGGIWQMGAGPAADSAGNVYVATGNGAKDSANDDNDANAFVKVAGVSWTGTRAARAVPSDYHWLAANDLDVGSTGPIILPGPDGDRVLGGGKVGIFTVLNTALTVQQRFRAAWHQWTPMLGNPSTLESGLLSCTDQACDSAIHPSWNGTHQCCPSGCNPNSGYAAAGDPCEIAVQGGYPHLHGQPTFFGGRVYWWAEKDFPRYMAWNASTGTASSISDANSRLSTSISDRAPNNQDANFGGAMPGGFTSLSAHPAGSKAILWAQVPVDNGDPPQDAYLKAFDVSGTLPKDHILQLQLHAKPQSKAVPTIANGNVYLAHSKTIAAYSNRPPSVPKWTTISGAARSLGSGWAIGTNAVGTLGDYAIYQWQPETDFWGSVAGGAKSITVDLNGAPWIVNNSGQIYKWNGTAFAAFGTSFCATAVASGEADDQTWAIHCGDQTIWRWTGSVWTQVGTGAGTKVAVFSSPDPTCPGNHLPFVLGTNGLIYIYQHTSCSPGDFTIINGGGSDITTDFAVGTDSNVYRWNPATSVWAPYITAPWGTATKIGGGVNGLYAMTPSGEIKRAVLQE